ncbi:hypothetical protein MMC13_000537 [Lambiella insularis]|nr:hypothetical protein [Lambiella insularis]
MDGKGADADLPLSLARKRRASSSLAGSSPVKSHADTSSSSTSAYSRRSSIARTPTKPKKKVRFSDPGPKGTGITPYIARTTLTPITTFDAPSSPCLLPRTPRRRKSLPAILTMLSPAGLPTPPLSGEIQFEPLRQILDERTRRRLRRNNLIDVINDIDFEKRIETKRREEIRGLKEELDLARQLGSEVVRNNGDEIGNRDQIVELEQEIQKLKEEMRGRSATAEPSPSECWHDTEAVGPASNDIHEGEDGEDDFQLVEGPNHYPQPNNDQACVEASTQTSFTSTEATSLQEHIRTQTEHLVKARLDLEYACPGETTLGLTAEQGNAKPILDAFLDRLRALKSQVRVSESALATTRMQESNLRNQFNIVLMQLDSARNTTKDIEAQNNHAAGIHATKVEELKAHVDEKQRSISKLQVALDSYRSEVKELEALVTRLEAEHRTTIASLRSEMDEAVADLDCHVAAETRGRREAEAESEQRLFEIKQLEASEKELKDAVNEKQTIVRDLEKELDDTKHARQCEVGVLNVKVSQLSSALSEAKIDLSKMETERVKLLQRLGDERSAATQIIETMREQMTQCVEGMDRMQETYHQGARERGREVAEHKGLLTPVDAVRFKDMEGCEGYVEVRRGKSRSKRGVDSGIGILEEDDEDMIV